MDLETDGKDQLDRTHDYTRRQLIERIPTTHILDKGNKKAQLSLTHPRDA